MPQDSALADDLLSWYDRHARKLPWRAPPGTPRQDPYRVWLSEIMLQQTVVATVGPYYAKFLKQWPDVKALAAAPLDDVLVAWAGLGYYARARNLHACAKVVAGKLGGRFPDTEEGLLELPGIGAYTAAAIAAIAFDRPANVVDGNVERVMARLHAVREPLPGVKPQLKTLAAQHAPQNRAGDYAQAVMDLGATICTPKSPACTLCPWREPCAARKAGIADTLPARTAKAARPTRRGVAFWLVREDGAVLLRRRPETGLLGGMMEVPSTPWREAAWERADAEALAPASLAWKPVPGMVEHVFTHFKLELSVMAAQTSKRGADAKVEGVWVKPEGLAGQALPSVMRKVVRLAASGIALAAALWVTLPASAQTSIQPVLPPIMGAPSRSQEPVQPQPAQPPQPARPQGAQQQGAQQQGSEQLFVLPPAGWAVGYHQKTGEVELTELVPPNQTVQDWSEMLSIEMVDNPPRKSSQEVLKDQLTQIQSECEDVGAGQVSPGIENGYETALRAIACTKSKKYAKGEMNLYKVLKGRDRLYVVARSWRGAPFDKAHQPLTQAQITEWLGFMGRVTVCDTRDPGRPCPVPGVK